MADEEEELYKVKRDKSFCSRWQIRKLYEDVRSQQSVNQILNYRTVKKIKSAMTNISELIKRTVQQMIGLLRIFLFKMKAIKVNMNRLQEQCTKREVDGLEKETTAY